MMEPNHVNLQKALDRLGNTHTIDDLLRDIKFNKKQSFGVNKSWVVTQVVEYPQFKAVEIWLVFGKREDIDELYRRVVVFAKKVGASKIRTYGRSGWGDEYVASFGFDPKVKLTLYQKDI